MLPAGRNKGTANAYRGAQREFGRWCEERYQGDLDALIVTESKLLLFLQSRVVGRQTKKRRHDGEGVQSIGIKSVLNVVSAVVDLWKRQTYLNVRTYCF